MAKTLIKVGGSLLSVPDLPDRIGPLIDTLPNEQIAFLVGGGEAADVVRQWDQVHQFDAVTAHWLAIDSLSLTAAFFAQLIPQACLCRSQAETIDCWQRGGLPVLVPRPFLEEFELRSGRCLPASWSITSDSIAAWIASLWPFDRLIFAKSVDAPTTGQPSDAVDDYLQSFPEPLPELGWVNLRADQPGRLTWRVKLRS